MKQKAWIIISVIFSLVMILAASSSARWQDCTGAVYTMTNDLNGNEVVVFARDSSGLLTLMDAYPTGGLGSGGSLDALGSQGSLVMSRNKRWLFAVNAGSNDISVFRILPQGLALAHTVGSGGDFPTSLTLYHNLLYVLNAGENPNITGFVLNHRCLLSPLNESTRYLNDGVFSQVAFGPYGRNVVITDRGNDQILVYPIMSDGTPSMEPVVSNSEGGAPFGFLFDRRGHLIVSEAAAGAVSSYDISANGELRVISSSVANSQNATCWIAANQRGYAFTANTASNTLSSYKIHPGKGALRLLEEIAGYGNLPLDLDTTVNGRFLYTLNAGDGTIGMFRIARRGRLIDLGVMEGPLEIFAQGMVAR
jgi:6-phosphogluconolactonase (cycloisomerase 2 family)